MMDDCGRLLQPDSSMQRSREANKERATQAREAGRRRPDHVFTG